MDSKLEQKVSDYVSVAKENKNVDVAALMLNALDVQNQNSLSDKVKKWGYLISLGVPPAGLLFAAYFYFSDKDDGKNAAYVCIVLTVVSMGLFVLTMKLFFSSAGVSVQQIQQIKPSDVQQLYQ